MEENVFQLPMMGLLAFITRCHVFLLRDIKININSTIITGF